MAKDLLGKPPPEGKPVAPREALIPAPGDGEPCLPSGGTYFLGRYRIIDEIGIGGMASVHLARADGPGGFQKWVAIKRIHSHLAEDDGFVRMFLDEARIAARISHPNVAQVFDLGKHRDTYWIAMEYLHGEPLREVIRAIEEGHAPSMSPQLAARIIVDAAEGLHAAHELRDKNGALLHLVHRDVTPHNLFLTYDGAVKVVDFGIAKMTGRLSTTRAGTLKGKIAYMSPEQVRGGPIDRRTDIFALGVVLWELTTGRRLFRTDSDLETLERVQACVVPPPSTQVDNYPVELEAIAMRALTKDPRRRYATAREMSRSLQQYLMRSGAFIGSEEIGAYVKRGLSDRFEKREAHLQWAAEVTQTVSLDQLNESIHEIEEVSVLTLASDVQEVRGQAKSPQNDARPVAGRIASHATSPALRQTPRPRPVTPPSGRPPRTPPPLPSHATANLHRLPPMTPAPPAMRRPSHPPALPLRSWPAPPLASSRPSPQKLSVPVPSRTSSQKLPLPTPVPSRPSPQKLPLPAPTPPPRAPLPRYELTGSDSNAESRAAGSRYVEDEDVETRVMNSSHAPTFMGSAASALGTAEARSKVSVHEPARRANPAPPPSAKIVVSPLASVPEHPATLLSPETPPVESAPSPPRARALSFSDTVQRLAPSRRARSLLLLVIAATTTIAAIALSTLLALKVLDRIRNSERRATPSTGVVAPVPGTLHHGIALRAAAPLRRADPVASTGPVDVNALPKMEPDEVTPQLTSQRSSRLPPAKLPSRVATSPESALRSTAPGYLTIVCDPFCDNVIVAGRNLGPSPVVRAPVPPGPHSVLLRRSGSPTRSTSVTIVSGESTALRVKLGP